MSFQQVQPHLFTFTNSLRTSLKNTPSSSKNASLHQLLNSTHQSSHLKTSPNESYLRDSAHPTLFNSIQDNHLKSRYSESKTQKLNRTQSIETSLRKKLFAKDKEKQGNIIAQKRNIAKSVSQDENQFDEYENLTHKKKVRKSIALMQMDMNTVDGNPINIKIDLRASLGQKSNCSEIKQSLKKSKLGPKEENIKVFVRFKPTQLQSEDCLEIINTQTIKIQSNYYCFDRIFPSSTEQTAIFQEVGEQMCKRLFEGYNGTIFAYGQTGSGKTYTIFGLQNQYNHGLIYRCIRSILQQAQSHQQNPTIECSMVELYKEQLIDMLNSSNQLKLKENKNGETYIEGLQEVRVHREEEMIQLVQIAAKSRKVSSTKLNQESSRSHTLLTIQVNFSKYSTKLRLIDLAGSEKVTKSGAKGQTFQETKKINSSLSCLGNVINALTTRSRAEHIPFRDSKLTRLLKDSLTGNFMTSIIVNCSACEQFIGETVSSLKFAERAKKIKVNVQSLYEQTVERESIQHLQSIIKKLKEDLKQTNKELQRYKQEEHHNKGKGKIILKKNNKIINTLHLNSESSGKEEKKGQDGANSECDLTARQIIPSERALVDEHIRKYCQQKHPSINSINSSKSYPLADFSSLNVSKSIPKLTDSPGLSSLQFKQCSFYFEEENPDFELSFTMQTQS